MSLSKSNKVIISIEGNIGVGKSTFINILKNLWPDCETVSEPVEIWKNLTDEDGKNILQIFYEDITRWAYSFQNVACITRMMKMEEAIKNSDKKYIFLDRSLGTDKHVFEKMLHDDGKINEIEHSMYNLWCDFYYKYVRSQNEMVYIYLKSTPSVCVDRIKKRGRKEEESITSEYLEGLNKYHDDWLLDSETEKVIVLDCDEEFESDINKQYLMIETLKNKLEKLLSN
jgi:deoxyadenosine/deoxycytidine kinase